MKQNTKTTGREIPRRTEKRERRIWKGKKKRRNKVKAMRTETNTHRHGGGSWGSLLVALGFWVFLFVGVSVCVGVSFFFSVAPFGLLGSGSSPACVLLQKEGPPRAFRPRNQQPYVCVCVPASLCLLRGTKRMKKSNAT